MMYRRNLTRNENLEQSHETDDDLTARNAEDDLENHRKLPVYRRILERLHVLKYIALILIIPPVLNFAALKRESVALLPVHGELIDMDLGQKMYIRCLGEGLPTVILDAPTGSSSDIWYLIHEQLSKVTQVCVYDRSGLGYSSVPSLKDLNNKRSGKSRILVSQIATLEQMTDDLHRLVTIGKPLPQPLMLVGSELGGLIARHYSMMYPEDVSDIVLLNPLVEDLFWRQRQAWDSFWNMQMLPSLESLQIAAFIGISRIAALVGLLKPDMTGGLVPKEVELNQLSLMCNPSHMTAVYHEHRLLNTSFSQMSELWNSKPFPHNISVTVINSGKFEKLPVQLQKVFQQSQLYLLQNLHPTSKHYVTDDYAGQLFKDPGLVLNKLQQIIYQWRIKHDFLPTVHTFREQEILAE